MPAPDQGAMPAPAQGAMPAPAPGAVLAPAQGAIPVPAQGATEEEADEDEDVDDLLEPEAAQEEQLGVQADEPSGTAQLVMS